MPRTELNDVAYVTSLFSIVIMHLLFGRFAANEDGFSIVGLATGAIISVYLLTSASSLKIRSHKFSTSLFVVALLAYVVYSTFWRLMPEGLTYQTSVSLIGPFLFYQMGYSVALVLTAFHADVAKGLPFKIRLDTRPKGSVWWLAVAAVGAMELHSFLVGGYRGALGTLLMVFFILLFAKSYSDALHERQILDRST